MSFDGEKILILGGSGYVGRHLFAKLGPQRAMATYHNNILLNGIRFNSRTMSLADILDADADVSHAIILLGETHIDSCAKDRIASHALNVESIINIVQDLMAAGIVLMFISSDNVFDGTQGSYRESDIPNPITTYGEQKLEVEAFIRSHCEEHCIVRLSKVFGDVPGDGTFFTAWTESLMRGDLIKVATDQIFSPVFIDDVVEGLICLIERNAQRLYHLCGPDALSRAGFLDLLIAEMASIVQSGSEVIRCSMYDFDVLERRPLNVSMDSDKFRAETGLRPRSVSEFLPGFVAKYINSPAS